MAKEDILCYKILVKPKFKCENLKSHYFGKSYETGREYSSLVMFDENPVFFAYVIYNHRLVPAYVESSSSERLEYPGYLRAEIVGNARLTGLRTTCGGFHSYTRYMNGEMRNEARGSLERLVAVRCRIPKGSRYYVSDDGMTYVSDKIVIDSIVEKKTD